MRQPRFLIQVGVFASATIMAAVFTPLAVAQGKAATTNREADKATEGPMVDPAAMKLFAQVAERYERLDYYGGVIEQRYSRPGKPVRHTRFRVALAPYGRGIIARFDARGTERWSYNQSRIVATASRRPKQYLEFPTYSNSFDHVARDYFFARAGFQGALPTFLMNRMGVALMAPGLRSVTCEPTIENGASKKIIVSVLGQERAGSATLMFFIDGDLNLRRALCQSHDMRTYPDGTWDETYSEIEVGRQQLDALDLAVAALPPKGYTRVESFDSRPVAMPPSTATLPRIPARAAKRP